MQQEVINHTTTEQEASQAPQGYFKMYWELAKPRLTWLVVFTGACGFLLASDGAIDWWGLLALTIGSFMVTGAANTINQVIEKDLDKQMKRTMNRPLPSGQISERQAVIFIVVMATLGSILLWTVLNPLTAWLTLLSLILYGFVYTPMKRISPISVLVGAFPGAFPPLIGWVAMTGEISHEAIVLFAIQFFWQFPHFWAIAWIGDEEYKKVGMKMLPFGRKDGSTVKQILSYSLVLLPLGVLPMGLGITGNISAIIAVLAAFMVLSQGVVLWKERSNKAALRVMFASIIYLPVVMIAFLVDKV
ncbi:heme o synthase [Algivirga pacifica]